MPDAINVEPHPLLITADGWSVSEVIYTLNSCIIGGGKTREHTVQSITWGSCFE